MELSPGLRDCRDHLTRVQTDLDHPIAEWARPELDRGLSERGAVQFLISRTVNHETTSVQDQGIHLNIRARFWQPDMRKRLSYLSCGKRRHLTL